MCVRGSRAITTNISTKMSKRNVKRKRKKLQKLLNGNPDACTLACERLKEHRNCFTFKKELYDYARNTEIVLHSKKSYTIMQAVFQNIPNLVTLELLGTGYHHEDNKDQDKRSTFICDENILENEEKETNEEDNSSKVQNGRYTGKFVSENVINLSKRKLTKYGISILSNRLKFVPTPTHLNRTVLKEELEKFGRRLRLLWHFKDKENCRIVNPF